MSKKLNTEQLRVELASLLAEFDDHADIPQLRERVCRLIPMHKVLQNLGKSLLSESTKISASARIISYLQEYSGEVISGDELMVVAGISEYARRVRELRRQEGWPILSGVTANAMRIEAEEAGLPADEAAPKMKPNEYFLAEDSQDREAAHRWHIANRIRKSKKGLQAKLLEYFLENVGQRLSSEELAYIAGKATSWARRTRELRTEEGWPIVTKFSGDPSLPMGVYVLAEKRQSPPHDRHIPELIRRAVMQRDNWGCRWKNCSWPNGFDVSIDHRFLEVHHIQEHVKGGVNEEQNLVTLCNLHHDEVHRGRELSLSTTTS